MTNQQAPETLRPIQRFNNVAGLMNPEARGLYVRYEDHVAALVEAQQPAPSAAVFGLRLVPVEPTDQMVQAAHHIDLSYMPGQEGADRAAIYRAMIAAAPQPAVQQWNDLIGKETHADADGLLVWRDEVDFAIPTPQADSQPAPEYVGNGMFKGETIQKAAEHWANWCDVRCMTGLSEFLRVVAARAPAESVPTAQFDDPKVQVVYAILCDDADPPKGEHWEGFAARRIVDALSADSVTAPAGPSKSLPYEPTSAMLIAARERDPALPIETVRAIYWAMWRTAPSPTPQADSQPAVTPETVYAAIAHGDQDHRAWLLSALRAVWCGEAVPPVADAAAPTPPAQAADSVLEDAARYRWLFDARTEAQVANVHDTVDTPLPQDEVLSRLQGFYMSKAHVDAIVDAARKQGGKP